MGPRLGNWKEILKRIFKSDSFYKLTIFKSLLFTSYYYNNLFNYIHVFGITAASKLC